MFTHLDISVSSTYKKIYEKYGYNSTNFHIKYSRINLFNIFGLFGNAANMVIDDAIDFLDKHAKLEDYKDEIKKIIYRIPQDLSIYLLYDIKKDCIFIFNEDELSILENEFYKDNTYNPDFIFSGKYADKENIVNFRKTIELFASKEKLNSILEKMNLIYSYDEALKIIEEEIDNIIKDIKDYIIKETGKKHLFNFYEFRIFDESLSNFDWLNRNIKKYKEYTEDNFKTVTDKKCLILHLDKNAVIKSSDNDKEYDIDSVNGYFPIFNGINYKGNKHYNELVYMEI